MSDVPHAASTVEESKFMNIKGLALEATTAVVRADHKLRCLFL